jgi:hypothetical protein
METRHRRALQVRLDAVRRDGCCLDAEFVDTTTGATVTRALALAPSTVAGAGTGVFALEPLAAGLVAVYGGRRTMVDDVDSLYTWAIEPYDPDTGEALSRPLAVAMGVDTDQGYVDASDPAVATWTRWVNCGPRAASNNLVKTQLFDTVLYETERDVAAGEELFIDYGAGYRRYNLGMVQDYGV